MSHRECCPKDGSRMIFSLTRYLGKHLNPLLSKSCFGGLLRNSNIHERKHEWNGVYGRILMKVENDGFLKNSVRS